MTGTNARTRPIIPPKSPTTLTFETLRVGDRFPLESYAITREEVIAFASKYDPQPYHLDDAAAAASPIFERLSASGWHTAVILNLLTDRFVKSTQLKGLAGGGIDGVRWLSPVYPGDTLSGDVEIVSVRASATRPERGVMTMRITLTNQQGTPVITMNLTGIFARGTLTA